MKKISFILLMLFSLAFTGCSNTTKLIDGQNVTHKPIVSAVQSFPYGTSIATDPAAVDTILLSNYNDWKSRYLTASGASGFLRVQRPENSGDTVSEGNSYGMLMSVLMKDKTTFDGIWNYTKLYLNAKGLMNWNINSAGTIIGTGSASDGDEDMALALIYADKTWGGYTTDATKIINSVLANDVSSTQYFKPGDSWGATNVVNPSYLSPAWYRVFSTYTGNTVWNNVTARSYEVINLVKNTSTGLLPDWTTTAGGSAAAVTWDTHKDDYYYDATRAPWRIAVDYLWNGEPQALNFSTTIASFFQSKGVTNIKDGYYLNGTQFGTNHNAAFVGPIACAAAAANLGQTFNDSIYNELVNIGTVGNYYKDTLRLVSLLVATGKFISPLGAPVPTVNHAPIANAGTAQTVKSYNLVTLNGSGSYDPDGNSITYQWTQSSGTSVALSNSTAAMPTFTPTLDGTYIFNLVVSDGTLSSNTASVTITVSTPSSKGKGKH